MARAMRSTVRAGDKVLMLDLNYGSQMKILAHYGVDEASITRLHAPFRNEGASFQPQVDSEQLLQAVEDGSVHTWCVGSALRGGWRRRG